jgi:hypothetical protein
VKKKILKEKMGGGAKGASYGINSSGPNPNKYNKQHISGYNTGAPQGDADSLFSQRLGMISTLEEEDNEEEQEESLYEFFTRIAKLHLIEEKQVDKQLCDIQSKYCKVHESDCTISEHQCDASIQSENELEEMSGVGAVGGVMGKFGLYNSDGSQTTSSQFKAQKKKQKKWK